MKALLKQLQADFPSVVFEASSQFYWSPKDRVVYYDPCKNTVKARWALLHELSHGLLGHTTYKSDFELLQLEVAAWKQSREVASAYGIGIDEEHVQDCLDTYRDWLHARSTCPTCTEHGLQNAQGLYNCLNCNSQWNVSKARFCRPYRRSATEKNSK